MSPTINDGPGASGPREGDGGTNVHSEGDEGGNCGESDGDPPAPAADGGDDAGPAALVTAEGTSALSR
eukprot:3849144-Alexandrium_andersonii.AAC.1